MQIRYEDIDGNIQNLGQEREAKIIAYDEQTDKQMGVVEYRYGANLMRLMHTYVDDAYRGMGIGLELVKAAVELAREKGWTILPRCGYAAKLLQGNPDYSDVL